MPMEVVSDFAKKERKWVSADGDTQIITAIEQDTKRYIQIKWESGVEGTLDLDCITAIYKMFIEPFLPPPRLVPSTGLQRPNIVDHTMSQAAPADIITEKVQQSMDNLDETTRPFESFAPTTAEQNEQPSQDQSLEGWESDASKRQNVKTGGYKKKGNEGQGFKRKPISANNII